jgi:hypothetical protein
MQDIYISHLEVATVECTVRVDDHQGEPPLEEVDLVRLRTERLAR